MSDRSTDRAPLDEASASSLYNRGIEAFREVYAGNVVELPEGVMPFNDVMMRTLFAQVWDRDVLSIEQRRLLLMGVIASSGATDVWAIQARAALARGELSADELRETLVTLAPYAGYPNVAALIMPTEEAIAAHKAGADSTDANPDSTDANPDSTDANPDRDA